MSASYEETNSFLAESHQPPPTPAWVEIGEERGVGGYWDSGCKNK